MEQPYRAPRLHSLVFAVVLALPDAHRQCHRKRYAQPNPVTESERVSVADSGCIYVGVSVTHAECAAAVPVAVAERVAVCVRHAEFHEFE
jgi:hypothetical protein